MQRTCRIFRSPILKVERLVWKLETHFVAAGRFELALSLRAVFSKFSTKRMVSSKSKLRVERNKAKLAVLNTTASVILSCICSINHTNHGKGQRTVNWDIAV